MRVGLRFGVPRLQDVDEREEVGTVKLGHWQAISSRVLQDHDNASQVGRWTTTLHRRRAARLAVAFSRVAVTHSLSGGSSLSHCMQIS